MEELFQEWAGIVRKIGEVPSAAEYMLHSQHSLTPLRKRFRYWNDVPAGMVQYADGERAGRAMGRRAGSSKEVQAGRENRGMETHAGSIVFKSQDPERTARCTASHSCGARWALPR